MRCIKILFAFTRVGAVGVGVGGDGVESGRNGSRRQGWQAFHAICGGQLNLSSHYFADFNVPELLSSSQVKTSDRATPKVLYEVYACQPLPSSMLPFLLNLISTKSHHHKWSVNPLPLDIKVWLLVFALKDWHIVIYLLAGICGSADIELESPPIGILAFSLAKSAEVDMVLLCRVQVDLEWKLSFEFRASCTCDGCAVAIFCDTAVPRALALAFIKAIRSASARV